MGNLITQEIDLHVKHPTHPVFYQLLLQLLQELQYLSNLIVNNHRSAVYTNSLSKTVFIHLCHIVWRLLTHGSMAKLRGNQAYRFNGDDTRYFYGQ